MEEYEVKFLDIDLEEIEKKILSLGGIKKFDKLFQRVVFDFPGFEMNKQGSWLRVRDEGDKITATYKKRIGIGEGNNGGDKGMEEVEIEVSDFEKTALLFSKLGMIKKFVEENRRIEYVIGSVKIDIDHWPLIKPYLEIEGESWSDVQRVAELLGFDWEKRFIASTMQVYKKYGITEMDYEIMIFSEQKKREV